ncbi:hypothetical protein Afil01_59000 [Actinorhabdospora filicis]|uniref:Uncharacterized protein n=1 Tax=Actinorhabdospora filicis TaxID=1785913 RepID=A0A9W6SRM8_9ACTN|nr:hypothetical protein [Actinorhabdospora filicis]GLZ81093.1 hypothetical protein Afil01_59000 [Actinorhabdospora filicis]
MKKVLEFSVRTTTSASAEEVCEAVSAALNVRFAEGKYEIIDAYVADFLGMRVGLFGWGADILLDSRLEDRRFLTAANQGGLVPVDIAEAIADMLTVMTPYSWRVPSDADLAADEEYSEEYDRLSAEDNAPPSWLDDEN